MVNSGLWQVDALGAEVAIDLIDAVEAADDQALQIKLRRDSRIEVYVERVVMGDKRTRETAPPAMGCIIGVSTSTKPLA